MAFGCVPQSARFFNNLNFALNETFSLDQTQNFGFGDAVSINAAGLLTPCVANTAGSANPPTADSVVYGIFLGCKYIPLANQFPSPSPSKNWVANTPIAAGTSVKVQLLDNPFVQFYIQCNGPLAAANVGNNFNLAPAAPNADGSSNYQLDAGGGGVTTPDRQVMLLGLYDEAPFTNTFASATPWVSCMFNLHRFNRGQYA